MRPPCFDDSGMPVKLGSPLRTPFYAWPNWGIHYDDHTELEQLLEASEQCYRSEWDQTSNCGHDEIAQAATEAGLGDANSRLNAAIAEVVCSVISHWGSSGLLKVIDLGAGAGGSTIAALKALEGVYQGQIEVALVDPATKALSQAGELLQRSSLLAPKNFALFNKTDRDFLAELTENSFDMIISGAAIHHHSYLLPVFELCFRALKPTGFMVIGDWHNSMWIHPYRVLMLLETLDWAGKQESLCRFRAVFPASDDPQPTVSALADQRANDQIEAFWQAYGRLQWASNEEFLMLEGHRPVEKYIEDLITVGFEVPRFLVEDVVNPYFLLPDSTLLAVITSFKRG